MRLAALVPVALIIPGCFAGEANLTESGKSKPVIEVSFPERSRPGAVETAVLEVSNPGPEDIQSLFVAFSLVGTPVAEGDPPQPLVGVGSRGSSPSVEEVRPEPRAVSPDGVVFKFGPGGAERFDPALPEGASVSLEFDIETPIQPGRAASSLQVYAGEDPDRAAGALLEILVTG